MERWALKTYRFRETEDFRRRAGVIALEHSVTLVADEKLMERAAEGCNFMNFVLAHEFGHLVLDHHAKGAVIKNFQLFSGAGGMAASIPPTVEELEANFAAVFFQCGVALEEGRWNTRQLAQRAFSDDLYVKKAQAVVQLSAFLRELERQRALDRLKSTLTRVIL